MTPVLNTIATRMPFVCQKERSTSANANRVTLPMVTPVKVSDFRHFFFDCCFIRVKPVF